MTSTTTRSDATATYRGYRLQALYILARMLEFGDGNDLIFQPEGFEDLAIFNNDNTLKEVVQVKAYSADLTLSVLSPNKQDSFVYRAISLLAENPGIEIEVASFGKIGSELAGLSRGNSLNRDKVVSKIVDCGFAKEPETQNLLSHLQFRSLDEVELKESVFRLLRELCTGVDPGSAFDILHFWLYICSEQKKKITRGDILQRVSKVGGFISERSAYHNEWFSSIVPVDDREIEEGERDLLSHEFYQGVSARYEHILAETDVIRPSKLEQIASCFRDQQVVIIHGSSGQGKTTLAYRYLRNSFPSYWRFQVRVVENRQHALSISSALSGQAKAIGVPIAIYIDVSPNDDGWIELVTRLSQISNIYILVTIREEDYNRASISSVELRFSEFRLQFDETEAQEVYYSLVEKQVPNQFICFEDAWTCFGNKGPLLEFVYLVTKGDSLRVRLQQQISRIQDQVRAGEREKGELLLLRLVAVASAYESRLMLRELIRSLDLSAPSRTLSILQNEYLIRINEDYSLIEGLHPIRSEILIDILIDPDIHPWIECANECIQLIYSLDIGLFLLHSFSRRTTDSRSLLKKLRSLPIREWCMAYGIIRALIWFGVSEYVTANLPLVIDIREDVGNAWHINLDWDIANVSPDAVESIRQVIMSRVSEAGRIRLESFRESQANKACVFAHIERWLTSFGGGLSSPGHDADWRGVSEVLFWLGRLHLITPTPVWLSTLDFDQAIEGTSIETLAALALGLFMSDESIYREWITKNYSRVTERVRLETRILSLEDKNGNIEAHFIVDCLNTNRDNRENRPAYAATEALTLLRKIFPDRERYISKGYGHRVLDDERIPDDSIKSVSNSSFFLQELVSINSMFIALTEKEFRLDTWDQYSQEIIAIRQLISNVMRQFIRGVERHLTQKDKPQIIGDHVNQALWSQCKYRLLRMPLLPLCAVDEWGYISESKAKTQQLEGEHTHQANKLALTSRGIALERYEKYIISLREFTSHLENFLSQSETVMTFHVHSRNQNNTNYQEIADQNSLRQNRHLSMTNLTDVRKSLSTLQHEFRKHFSPFLEAQNLDQIEDYERRVFYELWYIWYHFTFHPNKIFRSPKKECKELFEKKVKEIEKYLSQELRSLTDVQAGILSKTCRWEGLDTLWIAVDGDNPFDTYNALELILSAINRSINQVHPNELRRYAIDLSWEKVVIFPLYKGKSVDGNCWRLSSILFSSGTYPNMGPWNYVMLPVPENVMRQLGIELWTHSKLDFINRIRALVSFLSNMTWHLRDIGQLSELDPTGESILENYIEQFRDPLCEVVQAMVSSGNELNVFFRELIASPYGQSCQGLTNAIDEILSFYEWFFSLGEQVEDGFFSISLSIECFAELDPRLRIINRAILHIVLSTAKVYLNDQVSSEV